MKGTQTGQLQENKKKPKTNKWTKNPNRHFSKVDVRIANEKALNITNHQGNANKNHNELSPHTC